MNEWKTNTTLLFPDINNAISTLILQQEQEILHDNDNQTQQVLKTNITHSNNLIAQT